MYQIELVEEKNEPKEKPALDSLIKSLTTGLLLSLCQPIFGHGMIVVLDFYSCVPNALLKLKEHGVDAIPTIKKRRYWPWKVDGDTLSSHFLGSTVGNFDMIMGSYKDGDVKLTLSSPCVVTNAVLAFLTRES